MYQSYAEANNAIGFANGGIQMKVIFDFEKVFIQHPDTFFIFRKIQ
jgi:hypothetical protein